MSGPNLEHLRSRLAATAERLLDELDERLAAGEVGDLADLARGLSAAADALNAVSIFDEGPAGG